MQKRSSRMRTSSYKHRQASDFWYLTGFEEPDSAVILGVHVRLMIELPKLNDTRKKVVIQRVSNDSFLSRKGSS